MDKRCQIGWLGFILGLVALPMVGGCSSNSIISTGWNGNEGANAAGNHFIRIHYRLQEPGDVTTWGLHFWNAGAVAPEWGTPQLFDRVDDFGAYTDVPVTLVDDLPDVLDDGQSPWLGILPVQCTGNAPDIDCKKDIEQNARFFDLSKNSDDPNIAEGWITQGQAISKEPPLSNDTEPYKIERPRDFINPGNGPIRMMFRVPPRISTGDVDYGVGSNNLSKKESWSTTNDVNKEGLVIHGAQPNTQLFYTISLRNNKGDTLLSQTNELELTPAGFTPITEAKDWAAWGRTAVMYEVIVRTFADGGTARKVSNPGNESGIDTTTMDGIGDLVGLKNSLGYFKNELGVDTILLTPIFRSKSYHGYDIETFYDIDPQLGTLEDFDELTKAARTKGIKIVLDMVQSYVADTHDWFSKGSNPNHPEYDKYHDYFVWADRYSRMSMDRHPWDAGFIWTCKKYQCYHQVAGISLPQLNFRNANLREEMKNVAQFWIGHGVDGFRVTASNQIDVFDDNNGIDLNMHGTHVWWKDFNAYIKSLPTLSGKRAILIGDNRWDNPADLNNMVPYGSDMDSQLDFPFRTIVGNFINGTNDQQHDFISYMNSLQEALEKPGEGGNPNHFMLRFLSTHDFERPATQFKFSGDVQVAKLKQAATIILTVPGTPLLYYGEEFGKKGEGALFDGAYREEFKREPMSWFNNIVFNGDQIDYIKTNNANTGLKLLDGSPVAWGIPAAQNPNFPHIKYMSSPDDASWAAQKDNSDSLFAHYKKLIKIRRGHPVFTNVDTEIKLIRDEPELYVYTLESPSEKKITVVLHRTSGWKIFGSGAPSDDLLSGSTGEVFLIPPYEALILKQQ